MSDDEEFGDDHYEEDGNDGSDSKNPCFMMCLGMVMFPIALFLLGWNENNYVCEGQKILYAENKAKETDCTGKYIRDEFVFFSCPLQPETLKNFTTDTFTNSATLRMSSSANLTGTNMDEALGEQERFMPSLRWLGSDDACNEVCKSGGAPVECCCNWCDTNDKSWDIKCSWATKKCKTCPNCTNKEPPGTYPSRIDLFGQPSISGKRVVEMYLCIETCTKTKTKGGGNTKTCKYELKWKSDDSAPSFQPGCKLKLVKGCPGIQNSQNNYRNPKQFMNLPLGTKTEFANNVKAGVYSLADRLILGVTPDARKNPSTSWQDPDGHKFVVTQSEGQKVHMLEECKDRLKLGCVRISYYMSTVDTVSVFTRVGNVLGETEDQKIPGSWGCSSTLWQRLIPGKFTKKTAVESLNNTNVAQVWAIRIVGLVCAWLSIYCCLQPIAAAAEILGDCFNMCPCGGYVQDFIEGVVEMVLCFISCSVGCSCGIFVISLVWLFMRPLYGAGMMIACLCLCGAAAFVRKSSGAPKKKPRGDRSVREVEPATTISVVEMPQVTQPGIAAQPGPQMMQVMCPENVFPGMPIQVTSPAGQQLQVVVPAGVGPGMMFQVAI